jgi:catechol 2,3-dioxygenase-like lactoylglutathione lyase family enzyme
MKQSLGLVSVVVREYDEALAFYIGTLGFTLVEDTEVPEQNKRWVVVAPPGSTETRLLLARAANHEQVERIGNQTGGRVFLFLYTDNFERDYQAYKAKGVAFVRERTEEPYSYCVNKVMALYAPLHSSHEERWVQANGLIGT